MGLESKTWEWRPEMILLLTDFGGYAFNRNYDVAMLLFNHRIGQRDFLGTNTAERWNFECWKYCG